VEKRDYREVFKMTSFEIDEGLVTVAPILDRAGDPERRLGRPIIHRAPRHKPTLTPSEQLRLL
jgi:hypothetical protein